MNVTNLTKICITSDRHTENCPDRQAVSMECQMRQKLVYLVNWIVSDLLDPGTIYGIEVRSQERVLAFWRAFPRPRSIPRSTPRINLRNNIDTPRIVLPNDLENVPENVSRERSN